MKIFKVPLHFPRRADLPLFVILLIVGAACSGVAIHLFDWSLPQASAILFGCAGAAIATACGVDLVTHGLRGILIVVMIEIALVAAAAAVIYLLDYALGCG